MIPHELIPNPEMTVPEFWQYIGMAKAHPLVRNFEVKCREPKPGNIVVITFSDWAKKYNILIIGEFDWDAFPALREEWENNTLTTAS